MHFYYCIYGLSCYQYTYHKLGQTLHTELPPRAEPSPLCCLHCRFCETTCSPSSPSWRAWTFSRTTSPWWRTGRLVAFRSSPRYSCSTTVWGQPPRRCYCPCHALPTSVSTTTHGAAAAHWTAWSGPCRCRAIATWATTPSVMSRCGWGARSWRSWAWRRCARRKSRRAAGQEVVAVEVMGDRGLRLWSWSLRPPPCVAPTCSQDLCWTAAAKVRLKLVWSLLWIDLRCVIKYIYKKKST